MFQGGYDGNRAQLETAFHPKAHICGNFDGHYVDWSLDDFIDRTIQAQSHINEAFNKTVLNMEITGDIATVKALVITAAHHFTDYISLIKVNGKWLIRHKSFTNARA
ncbi:MAG: nuclear transport factor 2 family protein [Gammaproteobacteria bacterium]|nr:nuclear transport factor 2 family protein [Gammaproteobacteria bacterium]